MMVLLDGVDKISEFVSIVNHSNCDVDLISGNRTYLDAKSILGIMSCNIHEPLTLEIIGSQEEKEELLSQIKKFVV